MGEVEQQKPVKLFCSVIFKEATQAEKALKEMVALYGELEEKELSTSFDYTDYYEEEMGKPLYRKMLLFKNLVEKDNTARIKHESNRIEGNLATGGKRTVNLDPGYITEAKVVLLTTKDYTHRIYIGDKIFAESTLFFQDGSFNPWPWTYPDYGSDELRNYFNDSRDLYMKSRKAG